MIDFYIPLINPKYAFVIPIIAMIIWWTMLLAFLLTWIHEGEPEYTYLHYRTSFYYVSDIGATRLQGIFISFVALHGIFFIYTISLEYLLRKNGYLKSFVIREESILKDKFFQNTMFDKRIFKHKFFDNIMFRSTKIHHLIAIGFCVASVVFIFIASCIKNDEHRKPHDALVFIFVGLALFCLQENIAAYVIYAIHYKENVKTLVICIVLKSIFLVTALGLGVTFEVLYYRHVHPYSEIVEWTLCFYYPFIFILFAFDLSRKVTQKENDVEEGSQDINNKKDEIISEIEKYTISDSSNDNNVDLKKNEITSIDITAVDSSSSSE